MKEVLVAIVMVLAVLIAIGRYLLSVMSKVHKG